MPEATLNFDLYRPNPLLIVISGPSGVGKDSVVKELMKRNPKLHFVVTTTSRPPRQNEKEGIDYFFVTKTEFEGMIARSELIEYANVYEEYKGAARKQVTDAWASGMDVIMRVDVQGAARYRKLFPQALSHLSVAHQRRRIGFPIERPRNRNRRKYSYPNEYDPGRIGIPEYF